MAPPTFPIVESDGRRAVRWQFSVRGLFVLMTTVGSCAACIFYGLVPFMPLLIGVGILGLVQLAGVACIHWVREVSQTRWRTIGYVALWFALVQLLFTILICVFNDDLVGIYPWTMVALLLTFAIIVPIDVWRRGRQRSQSQ
jgi:hypothetical protein